MRIGCGSEAVRGNPSRCHFIDHKSRMTCSGLEPRPRGWNLATNRLSYGTTALFLYVFIVEKRISYSPSHAMHLN
jgi:hypothetical protein